MQERVRAILVHEDTLVLIKRVWQDRVYYVFPGGGVEKGETKVRALVRECQEELGVTVSVGKLFAEQEFRGDHEYFYICNYISGTFGTGDGPEYTKPKSYNGTHEVVRLKQEQLQGVEIMPHDIANNVVKKYFKRKKQKQ